MARDTNDAKRLMEELADSSLMNRYLCGVQTGKPGELVTSLPPEKRAILEKLSASDISDTRWPRPDGVNLEKMPRRRQ